MSVESDTIEKELEEIRDSLKSILKAEADFEAKWTTKDRNLYNIDKDAENRIVAVLEEIDELIEEISTK